MLVRLTLVEPGSNAATDLELRCAAGTTLGQARAHLLAAAGCDRDAVLTLAGARADDTLPIGRPPLVEGVVITASREGATATHEPGTTQPFLELHVVSGPDAGLVHRLTPGRHRVGRSPLAEISLRDVDVSRLHAELDVGTSGVTVRDTDSTNGTWLAGRRVAPEPAVLAVGAHLTVGSDQLALRLPERSVAALSPSGDGVVLVNRAPRLLQESVEHEIRLPAAPQAPEPPPFPVVALVLPIAVSVPMALLWSPFALLLGLTTPLMVLGNLVSDRRSGRRRHRAALARHREETTRLQTLLDASLAAEQLARRAWAPDAASVCAMVSTPSARLWERRPGDPDDLLLRVGTGTAPSRTTVVEGPPAEPRRARPELVDVPITLPLKEIGVVGVCGPREWTAGLGRFLLMQVAALHSHRAARIVVLCLDEDGAGDDWAWARWLPHVRDQGTDPPGVGVGPEQVRRRVAELAAMLAEREREEPGRGGADLPRPAVVVLLDGAHGLRSVPGLSELLERGPAHGIHLLCLDHERGRLPAECGAILEAAGELGSRLRLCTPGADDEPAPDRLPVADLVSAGRAHGFARAVAPLRDATPAHASTTLPEEVRLLDLTREHLQMDVCDPEALVAQWVRQPRSTCAVLGLTRAGVLAPDLRLDGPHVLLAGTTGSGKSELLQTLVASLAVVNRPDELTFVLVDYKGGAAFAECAGLPHTVGLVTDLDEHLTARALTSLASEIRRRERLLRSAGATDLPEYQRLLDGGAPGERLPRLVIVVDEFRVLAEELPDFVPGLVRLAAVGRSLGLHLVLATQRPGGAVGPDIRANVNLRIALRVRDRADSLDVVEAPDAAQIDGRRPGRAMARTGSGPLVELQAARVGGRARRRPDETVEVRRASWREIGAGSPPSPERDETAGPTDLSRVVRAVRLATDVLGVSVAPSPWLPPLPEVVRLDDARPLSGAGPAPGLVLGVVDEPGLMRQRAWTLDVAAGCSLAVVGTARSGRTNVLATVATAAADTSPAELHLYVVEGSGSALTMADRLPHTGAVVTRHDADRLARLLRRLAAEVGRRRAAPTTLQTTAILLLLDAWEAVRPAVEQTQHGRPLDDLLQVVREGPSVRVSTVVTGDRGLLTGRLASAVDQRLLLRTADPTDALLAGATTKELPLRMPPGRGLLIGQDGTTEVQVAVPPPWSQTVAAAGRWSHVPRDLLPFRVDGLPDSVQESALVTEDGSPALLVGVGGEDVRPLGFAAGARSLVVAGPPGSGRSFALAVIGRSLLRLGTPVSLVCPRVSPLPGLLPDAPRLEDQASAGAAPAGTRDGVVLVDDVDALEGTALEGVLLDHLAAAAGAGGGVVVAGAPGDLVARFRGLAAEVRRARTGLLLSPTGYADGDVLGVSVARTARVTPGRGFLVRAGVVEQIQVAAPAPAGGR